MPRTSISLLVVDDTKFSSVMIGRALQQIGYSDIRYASSGLQALETLEERAADIVLADWLMPGMDGLELSQKIRQRDADNEHYTYLILFTGRESSNAMSQAFAVGVDDFISKAEMNEQLMPRIQAAERIHRHIARLRADNQALALDNNQLKSINLQDPLTRLGNKRSLTRMLDKSLQHLESRGGKLCYILFNIDNMPELRKQHGADIQKELLRTIGQRLEYLVRPLDYLARLDGNQFVMLNIMDESVDIGAQSYKRLHDALNLKPCKSSIGFLALTTSISLVSLTSKVLPVTAAHIMPLAQQNLQHAQDSGRVHHQAITRSSQ